jgi:hypothetical protein
MLVNGHLDRFSKMSQWTILMLYVSNTHIRSFTRFSLSLAQGSSTSHLHFTLSSANIPSPKTSTDLVLYKGFCVIHSAINCDLRQWEELNRALGVPWPGFIS